MTLDTSSKPTVNISYESTAIIYSYNAVNIFLCCCSKVSSPKTLDTTVIKCKTKFTNRRYRRFTFPVYFVKSISVPNNSQCCNYVHAWGNNKNLQCIKTYLSTSCPIIPLQTKLNTASGNFNLHLNSLSS